MSAALIAGSIPFCALGLMIGTLVTGSAAPGYANLIYLPGCYLSGLFFPLPQSMHWQTPIWPQFHINQLAMHAAGVTKFQFMPVQMAIAGTGGLHGAVQRRCHLEAGAQGLSPFSHPLCVRYGCRSTRRGNQMSATNRRGFLQAAGIAGMFSGVSESRWRRERPRECLARAPSTRPIPRARKLLRRTTSSFPLSASTTRTSMA